MGRADRERFERMISAYSPDLFRYALVLSRSRATAEDLVQETFLRAWRQFHSLRDESRAKGWLLTTLRREHLRQFERYRPTWEDVDVDQLVAPEHGPSDEVRSLREAIFALPEIHRDVLALQVLFGFTGAEIGGILGLSRATVNTRLFRARQQVKRRVERSRAPLRKGAAR